MEGKSHRIGGTVAALSGYLFLKEKGVLLSPDVASPVYQMLTIYVAGIYGGMWSDNDHHWESSPLKDPLSWVQNKILHLGNKRYKRLDKTLKGKQKKSLHYKVAKLLACRHRSWQTHSEFTLASILLVFGLVNSLFANTAFNLAFSWLMMLGFFLGVLSHLVLDCLTTEGIRFASGIWLNTFFDLHIPETIRIVPKSSYFSTGSPWELAIRKWLQGLQYLLVIVVLIDLAGFNPLQLIV